MLRKFLVTLTLMIAATPALAVDLTAQITQLNGKPLSGPDGKPLPMSLGDVIENSLLTTEQSTTPTDKNKHFWLAFKVHDKKSVNFTTDELVEIKDAIGKYNSALVAGQAIRILDPTSIPKDIKQ